MCLMTTTSNEGTSQQQHSSQPDGSGHHPPPGGGIGANDEGSRFTSSSPPPSSSGAAPVVAVDDFGFKYDDQEDEDDGPSLSLASSLASLEPAAGVVAPTAESSPEFQRAEGGDGSAGNLAGSGSGGDANDEAVATSSPANKDDATATTSTANGKAWPRKGIAKPHPNDVLYGRGGGTNHHPGNKRYRKMVEDRKHRYVNSKRLEKPLIAFEIIKIWRTQDPPGRFLKKDKSTGLWNDVGDAQARKKTSQALREQAPLIRELGIGELGDDFDELEFDVDGHGNMDDDDDNDSPRSSVGRKAPEQVDVEVEHVLMDEECNVPVKAAAAAATAAAGRTSFQVPAESTGSGRMEWRGYTSEQLMVAEGEVSTGRGLSFGIREHSLGDYPLEHATVTQTAIDAAFDKRSGAWATPPNYFAIAHSHSLTATIEAGAGGETEQDESPIPSATTSPSSAMRGAIDVEPPSVHAIRSPSLASDDTPVTAISKDAMKRATSHQNENFETKRYLVGPSVKRVALSRGDTTDAAASHLVSDDTLDAALADAAMAAAAAVAASSSSSSPRVARQPFKDDLEMRELTQSMEKSSLFSEDELGPLPSSSQFELPPPMASRTVTALAADRLTTIDHIAMDLMVHPVSLSRTNTEEIIRTLASDLDEGTVRSLLSGGGYDLLDRTKSS